eukprot:TRINITY_DN377_c0_g2_i1.p2 TRINITY_DN377_c0_g2~~TRINITY_DN377_c0_g2_i1.p2  ORF type:complete len:195 (-),score=126.77 TRINITY_DN377_c0_g2_i1:48-632(-)
MPPPSVKRERFDENATPQPPPPLAIDNRASSASGEWCDNGGSVDAAPPIFNRDSKVFQQFLWQIRDAMREQVRAEIDTAVEDATASLRADYEQQLRASRARATVLGEQVDALQKQLARMQLDGEALDQPLNDDDADADDAVSAWLTDDSVSRKRRLCSSRAVSPTCRAADSIFALNSSAGGAWFEQPNSPELAF